MKKIFCLFVLFLFCIAGKSLADEKQGGMQHQMKRETAAAANQAQAMPKAQKDAAVTDANNKTCPISGDPVNGKDFVVYNGKRYGLCCTGCDKQFLSDPEKYIKILKDRGDIK